VRPGLALIVAGVAAWMPPAALTAAGPTTTITVRVYQSAGLTPALEQRALEGAAAALRPALDEPVFSLYARLNASLTAPPEVIAEAARNNDVAVTALGHCGSCTSSATRDAVALAGAGIPVCVLISEKFHEMSGFIARSVGMPDLPRVKLPHPVAGTGAARIAEIAAGAAPVIISMWEAAHVPA